jgi:hypothetical protein
LVPFRYRTIGTGRLRVTRNCKAIANATGSRIDNVAKVCATMEKGGNMSDQLRSRTGVRQEILEAVEAVLTRSGGMTFTVAEIITEMVRSRTSYAESTVRTMITGHMCRNAPDNAGTTYDDFERVGRGTYRLVVGRQPGNR